MRKKTSKEFGCILTHEQEEFINDGRPYPKSKQVARIGNSVVPIMAQKLVEANCGYLKVGERIPKLYINDDSPQLSFM